MADVRRGAECHAQEQSDGYSGQGKHADPMNATLRSFSTLRVTGCFVPRAVWNETRMLCVAVHARAFTVRAAWLNLLM